MSTAATRMTNAATRFTFTSESVSEGHPDKVCDLIADSILDAYLEQDDRSHVACEVLCKEDTVVLAGEITSAGKVDHEEVTRQAIREIGYTEPNEPFNADGVKIIQLLTKQSSEINQGVDSAITEHGDQGAGDQGIMFGYASDETAELMPLPIHLAHKLAKQLADDRRAGVVNWLRPDSKTQVSVIYEGNEPKFVSDVVVSTQHFEGISQDEIRNYVVDKLAPPALAEWFSSETRFLVNPTGSFSHGGPSADCGVTGRKIIVDSYGGMAPHGGGAFSGKDPSKVDRSGAYFCRFVARELVKSGLARKAQVQVAYAIGVAQPVSIKVETFGTGDDQEAVEFTKGFDFRPAAIIERLNLLRPIYRETTNYGHFGRPGLPWEA
jgi:S-adenosylmethionine synthetase